MVAPLVALEIVTDRGLLKSFPFGFRIGVATVPAAWTAETDTIEIWSNTKRKILLVRMTRPFENVTGLFGTTTHFRTLNSQNGPRTRHETHHHSSPVRMSLHIRGAVPPCKPMGRRFLRSAQERRLVLDRHLVRDRAPQTADTRSTRRTRIIRVNLRVASSGQELRPAQWSDNFREQVSR